MNQKAVVKIQQEFSDESEIGPGVRQGCCMSPLLFIIYDRENTFKKIQMSHIQAPRNKEHTKYYISWIYCNK
jgi:hypothetical protein